MSNAPEAITESFRRAAMFLFNAVREQRIDAVLFAGLRGGEGTTTAVLHVARELRASFGLRPLVVEMSRKKPAVRAALKLPAYDKTIESIAAGVPLHECVQVCPDGLEVVTASDHTGDNGRLTPVDAALRRTLDQAKQVYDIVLVDALPVLVYADAMIAGAVLPNMMLVVQAGKTRYEMIDRVRRDLANQKITVLGAILNRHRDFIPGWLYRVFIR